MNVVHIFGFYRKLEIFKKKAEYGDASSVWWHSHRHIRRILVVFSFGRSSASVKTQRDAPFLSAVHLNKEMRK